MTNNYIGLPLKVFLWLSFLILLLSLSAQNWRQITPDDIWKNGTFTVKNVPGFNALKDGKRYSRLEDGVAEPGDQYLRSGQRQESKNYFQRQCAR